MLNADTVFQTVFSEISPEFDKLAGANRAAVLDLQKAIEEVMELDVRIRGMEQKNKALTEPVKQRRSGAPKSGKNHVLNLYKENSRKKEKQNREDATLPKR